jgi:two-component system, OmpR family, phosphate regulon sensor histidine kinase PhoR
MAQPTIGLDRSGAVRFFSESFKPLYPSLKEGKALWQQLPSDPFVRWVSDCLDSTDPALREQIMGHFEDNLWMARLEPIFGDAGRCSGFILTLKDVAPVQPMTESLDSLLGEVRDGLSRPLAGIKSRLEVLLEGAYKEPEFTVELLQQLNEDSNQLARLLFSLENPEGQSAPELPTDTATSLKQIAAAVHHTFEPLARSKNLALKLEFDKAGVELSTVSEDELKLCLTNLVDNAIKYTALNGYGEVVMGLETDLEGVTLKVDDSGPGVPAVARDVVFEQFYRLTEGPTTQLGGTGLGLWRVREVARKRAGRVWIEDSPKGGAGLRLWFPLAI